MPRILLGLLIVVSLLVAACNGSDSVSEQTTTTVDEEAKEDEEEGEEEEEPAGEGGSDEPIVTGQSFEPVELTAELLTERIAMGVDYLIGAVGEDGRFVYRINLSGETPSPAYNVLRHAGTIYALGQAYEDDPDPQLADAISRASNYLIQRYIRPPERRFHWLAVFSRPEEESLDTDEPEAKLGGAGLGLLALDAAREAGADVSLDTMIGLGEFILFMQNGDGSFHSRYSESEGYLAIESLFYPGEAILGLLRLYESDPDPRWLHAAALGTGYLVESRRGQTDIPSDHWLMLGMEPLLEHLGDLERPPVSPTEVRDHMLQLGLSMISDQDRAESDGAPTGSFSRTGSCTSTATRLEGMSALWRSMADWGLESDRERIAEAILVGAEFLVTCQVVEGPAAGGVLRAQRPLESEDASFNQRQTEIRIDYVQHAMSAMRGARDVVSAERE